MWLAADPRQKLHVYSFDADKHTYVRPMAQYLQEVFPGRLNVTFGDSKQTLRQFHDQNPHIKCDLVVIDGGHYKPTPLRDFENFSRMVTNSSGHLILLDDWPSETLPDVGKMWKSVTASGRAVTIAQCKRYQNRGLTIGMYTNHTEIKKTVMNAKN